MAPKIPEIKRTIASYMSDETGRISKHSVLSLGAIIASVAILSTKLKEANAQTAHSHSHLSSPPIVPIGGGGGGGVAAHASY